MAHAPLMRTQTAPVFQQSGTPSPGGMTPNVRASQPPPMSNPGGGGGGALQSLAGSIPIMNTHSILNQRADASRSLYQICVTLSRRLAQVPDFDEFLAMLDPMDPVESMWALLRTGRPLLTIYNALQPSRLLVVDNRLSEAKKTQKAVFEFARACMNDLKIPSFVLRDLSDNDTTGFVKVCAVVNAVLDIADDRGLLLQQRASEAELTSGPGPGGKMSQRDYIVTELVDTERKYVQDLDNLYDLKETLGRSSDVSGDVIHQIFLNLQAILDFQRRFLVKIETNNSMPPDQQRWGAPFAAYEDSFDIYQQFIANQRKAALTASQTFEKIRATNHPVASDLVSLTGFLNKPMQRLTKYPLLLKSLFKAVDNDEMKADLQAGLDATERVLGKANESVNRDMLDEAYEDLVARVDDWKTHSPKQFGSLLLHGVYGVVTGKSDAEKDYEIYLFDTILLCCKEVLPNKGKDKNKEKTRSMGPRAPNKSARLQLKGRIFMSNVTDVWSMSKPGTHSVQIWWKGDPGVENFTIKFQQEDVMKKWAALLVQKRQEAAPKSSAASDNLTDFPWIRAQGIGLENPYAQQDDTDDDDATLVSNGSGPTSQFGPPTNSTIGTMSRNASSTSLRKRSLTGDSTQSLTGMIRGPPPRFPLPAAPPSSLTLQTGAASAAIPRNIADSYFSPVTESPPSSRASTTSGLFPTLNSAYTFPRGSTPGGWEDNNRYTAPAMPRAPSRDGNSPAGQSGMSGRPPRGPSLPAPPRANAMGGGGGGGEGGGGVRGNGGAGGIKGGMGGGGGGGSGGNLSQSQRSRSLSLADINGAPVPRRNTHGAVQPNVPAVPGIPEHMHLQDPKIPRSQTASPRGTELPVRTSTQSPGTARGAHSHQQSGSYGGGGIMTQFPLQPLHRHNTASSQLSQMSQMSQMSQASQASQGSQQLYSQSHPQQQLTVDSTGSRTVSPAPPGGGGMAGAAASGLSSPDNPGSMSQVKVKVSCESGEYFTLVASYSITYQSLIDRIDAKLARFTTSSIGRDQLKLRYQDEDGDLITIQSDDDIQIAFLEWREGVRNMYSGGGIGEIQLYCTGDLA